MSHRQIFFVSSRRGCLSGWQHPPSWKNIVGWTLFCLLPPEYTLISSLYKLRGWKSTHLICTHKTWRKLTHGVSGYFNWLRKILTKKILWSVVMTLPFFASCRNLCHHVLFLKVIRQRQDVKKITSMTNNITCKNYCRRYFWYSKLVGCTTSVLPSPLFIHVAYGEASIPLEIWDRGKRYSWSWPHHVTICLTTELHSGSYGRNHLWWRLSCKYRWCCIDVINERKKWGFFLGFSVLRSDSDISDIS